MRDSNPVASKKRKNTTYRRSGLCQSRNVFVRQKSAPSPDHKIKRKHRNRTLRCFLFLTFLTLEGFCWIGVSRQALFPVSILHRFRRGLLPAPGLNLPGVPISIFHRPRVQLFPRPRPGLHSPPSRCSIGSGAVFIRPPARPSFGPAPAPEGYSACDSSAAGAAGISACGTTADSSSTRRS